MDKPQDVDFVLGSYPLTFDWTVRVPIPGADRYQLAAMVLTFATVDQPELDRMKGTHLAKGQTVPTDEQICRQVVKGWPSMKDAAGQPVPFSEAALTQLLAVPVVRASIAATYLVAMSGAAAQKNV